MTGQQLKNSILQMAVQGKLVPQDPNDEPASVLLERIRAEKEALIKAGKIKKEKNPSVIFRGADNLPYEKVGKNEPVCIADEVPFDIPDSWEWVRFSSIIELKSGQDMTPDKYNSIGKGIPYLTGASNIEDGRVIINRWTEYGKAFAYKGELLITCKGTVGTMAILQEEQAHIARQIMSIKPNQLIDIEYIKLVLETLVTTLKAAAKSMIPGISRDDILLSLLPLPPKEEQTRIVHFFKSILPFVDEYTKNEITLQNLNRTFPELLKKSILQQAVQGKLVPQDENDEPASILLECIRAEKQALVKAGKIKKDKNESVIFRRDNSHYEKLNEIERCIDDEIPFEIPENWCWCRLSEIATVIRGLTFSSSSKETKEGLSLVLRGGNIDSKTEKLNFTDNIYVDTNIIKDVQFLRKGDTLIVASSGTKSSVGKSCYIDEDLHNTSFGGFMMTVRPNNRVSGEYIATNIKLYRQKIIASTAGYISNITNPILNNLLIPLPPINEQKRIIEAINRLSTHIEKL